MHKKPLSIETEDMESIEFNFLKQYSKYLVNNLKLYFKAYLE